MASLTAIGFHAASAVAVAGALVAVFSRKPERSLAGFALALAALIVPLVQLEATLVAAAVLLAAGVCVALLGGLSRLAPASGAKAPRALSFWIPAGLGLAAFVWVLLASGSRQVVEPFPPLERRAVGYGVGERVLARIAGEHLVSATLVGLLALCCVIAAVLSLVGEEQR